MAYKVVIPQDITAPGKDYLLERGYEVVIGSGSTKVEDIQKEIADADALLVRTAPYTAEILSAAKKLKVIGRHGIGVDNIDLGYCKDHNIVVTFAPTSNSITVAEHTMGLMIAAAHNIVRTDAGMRKGLWEIRNQFNGYDLEGKTVGLVGMGRIGAMVTKMAYEGMGMKVIGYDPYLPVERYPKGAEKVETVEEIFEKADFVSIHMPSTPETRGMFNKKLFALMKPSAIFVNCARGDLVNIDDLYEVLKDGKIYAAGIDVWPTEPPKFDHPIFGLDNIICTPHNAALTQEAMDRMGLHAAMGIHSVLSGEEPAWPVRL